MTFGRITLRLPRQVLAPNVRRRSPTCTAPMRLASTAARSPRPRIARRRRAASTRARSRAARALHAAAPDAPELEHEAVEVLGYQAVPPSADVSPAKTDLGIVLRDPTEVVKATVATLREKARL